MRPGAGRPPKPLAERQRHAVAAKFTDAELEALKKAAAGKPLGTLLRRLALRHLARRSER
jgi:hypothetical protein